MWLKQCRGGLGAAPNAHVSVPWLATGVLMFLVWAVQSMAISQQVSSWMFDRGHMELSGKQYAGAEVRLASLNHDMVLSCGGVHLYLLSADRKDPSLRRVCQCPGVLHQSLSLGLLHHPRNLGLIDEELPSCSSSRDDEETGWFLEREGFLAERKRS